MESALLFALAGVGLFCIGLRALVMHAHLLRKILAINLMGSGVFLVLVAPADPGDPVPQAMVITGIVVAVSATAFALNLMLKLVHATGRAVLDPGETKDNNVESDLR
ncbi:MAG: NADH-quinone oxidoreductase subunit K [Halieaceae bacterium]|jgi:multicomponent Na+:H+ antiporter subunit C|nr:NADH-quinone oxidoreductase subunit K [Halieaceae bacterium]